MPWKDMTMNTQRQLLCYRIDQNKESVTQVCREMGVSRKTAYKWLERYRADPQAVLSELSRRPRHSPRRTALEIEQDVLAIRDEHRWGGRKIKFRLQEICRCVPSIRTVSQILKRAGRTASLPAKEPDEAPMRFERSKPNELWQLDHLGPREIARQRHFGFTVMDDHSRFCFCFDPLINTSLVSYWPVLWRVFGEYGLPESILCDNAFGPRGLGMSHLEMRLIRLGIDPIHGRPYHPQTQGKVERLNGTIDYELINFKARTDRMDHFLEDRSAGWRTYNFIRPHEALGDKPPISRYLPSERRRPDELPTIQYDIGQTLRKVSQVGDIRFNGTRISVARCLVGEQVRIEEREHEIAVFYSWKELRTISREKLKTNRRNEIV